LRKRLEETKEMSRCWPGRLCVEEFEEFEVRGKAKGVEFKGVDVVRGFQAAKIPD